MEFYKPNDVMTKDVVVNTFSFLNYQFENNIEDPPMMDAILEIFKYKKKTVLESLVKEFLALGPDRSTWLMNLQNVQVPLKVLDNLEFRKHVVQELQKHGKHAVVTMRGNGTLWVLFDKLVRTNDPDAVKLFDNISQRIGRKPKHSSQYFKDVSDIPNFVMTTLANQLKRPLVGAKQLVTLISSSETPLINLQIIQQLSIIVLQDTRWHNPATFSQLAWCFACNPDSLLKHSNMQMLPICVLWHLKDSHLSHLLSYCQYHAVPMVQSRIGRELLLMTMELCRKPMISARIFKDLIREFDNLCQYDSYLRTLWYLADHTRVKERRDFETGFRLRLTHHCKIRHLNDYIVTVRSKVSADVAELYDTHHESWESGFITGRMSPVMRETIMSLTLNFIGSIARLPSNDIISLQAKNNGQEILSFRRIIQKYRHLEMIKIFDLRQVLVTICRLRFSTDDPTKYDYRKRALIQVESDDFTVSSCCRVMIIPIFVRYDAFNANFLSHSCILVIQLNKEKSDMRLEAHLLDGYRNEFGNQDMYTELIRSHVIRHIQKKIVPLIGRKTLHLNRNSLGNHFMLPFNNCCFMLTCWAVDNLCSHLRLNLDFNPANLKLPGHPSEIAKDLLKTQQDYMEFDEEFARNYISDSKPDPPELDDDGERIEKILSHSPHSSKFCDCEEDNPTQLVLQRCSGQYDFLVKMLGVPLSGSRWMCECDALKLTDNQDNFKSLLHKYMEDCIGHNSTKSS